MNRRNFFSLVLGAPIAAALGIKPRSLEAQFKADLEHWFAKYGHLFPGLKRPSVLDFEPLDLGTYTPSQGTSAHTHSISDPGHSHSSSSCWTKNSVNPNWIPCKGQWVHIDGVGRFEVVG